MVCRVKASFERVHQPVLFRRTGGLPLEQTLPRQARSQLDDNLCLRQLGDRFRVPQPEVGAGQRLARLGKHVTNQRPAKRLCPLRRKLTFRRTHPPGYHHAALLTPEEPVALFSAFQMRLLAQPGFFALPPVSQLLLPDEASIVHFTVQRLGKRAVNV